METSRMKSRRRYSTAQWKEQFRAKAILTDGAFIDKRFAAFL